MAGGPQSVSKHRGIEEFTIVFSSSAQGADGVIERMLMAAKQPERIVVITNDGLIRNCRLCSSSHCDEEWRKLLRDWITRSKLPFP